MTTDTIEESGISELLRLSAEISNVENRLVQGVVEPARKRIDSVRKKKLLQRLLKEIKVSIVLEQLVPVCKPEIIAEISSFRNKQGKAELGRLILDLLADLEKSVDSGGDSGPDPVLVKRLVKTLAILIDLFLYLG